MQVIKTDENGPDLARQGTNCVQKRCKYSDKGTLGVSETTVLHYTAVAMNYE